jgi:hypothetical protein
VTGCYIEKWRGELDQHTVSMLRDDADQNFIYAKTLDGAKRWNLSTLDPRARRGSIGAVPQDVGEKIWCERPSFEL